MKKGFTRPNSPIRKNGRRNIHGSSVMILVKARACFVPPAKSGVSLQQALEVHGWHETDWNHGTGPLKKHEASKWHQDATTAAIAEQAEKGKSVLELQCASAAKEAAERTQRNRDVLLKLSRSVYFLAKNRIPHLTTYLQLVELLLEQHISYTVKC